MFIDDTVIWFGDGECFVKKDVLIEEPFARLIGSSRLLRQVVTRDGLILLTPSL